MLSDEEEDEWMMYFSSAMLSFEEISKCHEHAQAPTVPILQEFLQYLLQQIFNTSCRWWLAQEQAKGMMKFDEKSWRNLREFERIWDEKCLDLELWCVDAEFCYD